MKRSYIFILLILSGYLSKAQTPSTCFEIQSILVDACGSPEGENEMVSFIVGPNDLNVANLNVTWPNNSFLGICQSVQTTANVDSLNTTIVSCGHIVEPIGGVLPAGASVLLVTSVNMNPTFNSFAGLSDTLYMIFQCAGNTQGHFKNYAAGSGFRTLEMDFGPGCSDTVTYNVDSLIDQTGIHAAQDGATANFTYLGADTYTNPGCQAPIISLSATLNTNKDSICAGDTILVQATVNSGNYTSFFWLPGMGSYLSTLFLTTAYVANSSFTGSDLLIFGIIGTCGDTVYDSLTVFINNGGTISVAASGPLTFCQGDSVILTASGATNYLWNTGESTAALTVFSAGTYVVDGSGACGSAKDSVTVTVVNDNAIVFSQAGPNTICTGDSVILSVLGGGSAFLWSNGNTTSSITVTTTGTYSVSVTGQCGTKNFNQTISVIAPPVISITLSDSVLCNGETALITASGGTGYVWSNGQTTAAISVTTAGNYTVSSSNSCGSDSGSVSIVTGLLNVAFISDKDSGNAPLSVQFTNQSVGATSYNWLFGDGGQSNDTNPSYTFLTPGTYQVSLIAEDANGCRDTAVLNITVKEDSTSLQIPNVFSPNGDNYNQFFNVKGTGIKSVSGKIYNRWGIEISSWNTINEGWDGKAKNGQEAPVGTYFYTIKVTFSTNEEVSKNGHLTLVK